MTERITNTVAAGAVTSPWWIPSLADVSSMAALLLPILGCGWLIVQIILKITERKKEPVMDDMGEGRAFWVWLSIICIACSLATVMAVFLTVNAGAVA